MTEALASRSTPGSTSRYSAVSPERTGSGSGEGQRSVKDLPSSPRVTKSDEPAAAKVRSTTAAFGPTVPSGRRSRVASAFSHVPSGRSTRCGWTLVSLVSEPSGLAKTSSSSVRC
ncbi:hypothetical protein QFZ49_003263 [Streptomyces turgidiscabies]|uniref:Uncharacterized protein n=1 Tax=Streptomyces turgidiscabies TaxID=85558 RepID=A0ABU0RMU7_9ACTN|nr:hypothetical protein [Streptomyces turgidiscabies]